MDVVFSYETPHEDFHCLNTKVPPNSMGHLKINLQIKRKQVFFIYFKMGFILTVR
jgi:hypothetical protein